MSSNNLHKAKDMFIKYSSIFPTVPIISNDDILLQINEAIIVDVRSPAEMQVSMLPNAITSLEFEKRVDSIPKNALIVPYCTIGYRSGQYGSELMRRGFSNVKNGEGIILWTYLKDSYLVCNDQKTRKVHVFGSTWNVASEHYQSVMYSKTQISMMSIQNHIASNWIHYSAAATAIVLCTVYFLMGN
jgi:rhodanese-related sulfurtransferase